MALRRAEGFVRYAFSVQYHGAPFLGFAYQGNQGENCVLKDGTDLRGCQSVEGRLHEAFQTLVGHDNYENIQVSSRTDRGVHALKNTCHVDIRPRRRSRRTIITTNTQQFHQRQEEDILLMPPSPCWDPQNLHRGLNYHLVRQQQQQQQQQQLMYGMGNNNVDDADNMAWNKQQQQQQQQGNRHLRRHAASSSHSLDLRILSVVPAPSSMKNKFYNAPERDDDYHYPLEEEEEEEEKRQNQSQQPPTIDWNARFSATQRTYVYRTLNFTNDERDYGIPFEGDRSFRVTTKDKPLDVQAMQEASAFLVGTHDFTSFRGSNCQRLSPWVTMKDIRIHSQPYGDGGLFFGGGSGSSCFHTHTTTTKNANNYNYNNGGGGLLGMMGGGGHCNNNVNLITIMITGESFLYRQVRNMVGCLLDVGKGKLTVNDVKDILEARDRRQAPAMVPAHGLFLVDVQHGDFSF